MRNVKVALIQNRVQKGGRFQVSVEMIKALNEMGIVPDFITYRNRIKEEEVFEAYGESIEFNFINIPEPKVPFEWNILAFNRQVGKYLKDYGLVINSNNTSFLLKRALNCISYVHFPRKFRMRTQQRSIHIEGKKRSLFDFGSDAFKLASFLYRFDQTIAPTDLQLANSAFTKRAIQQAYVKYNHEIEVLYPPVAFTLEQPDKVRNQVVSLGRFAVDKKQLEQIKLFANYPEFTFCLVGFVNDERYFEQCKAYIEKHDLQHIKLYPAVSAQERDLVLRESEFFLHSLINEPFGITAVQAIAKGCLPLVHNSGGQMEIVPIDELRYNNYADLEEKLETLPKVDVEVRTRWLESLQKNIAQYNAAVFRTRFKEITSSKLKQTEGV